MNNLTIANFAYGKSLISELEEKVTKFARVSHYILITGERGTGKTTLARRIHTQSPRAKREFVNLNCASLTQELLESELFGYEKGAFTGATMPKIGLFEIANGGTLFLDEIGELPLHLQSKLLKAVEEKRIRRVGSNVERTVDTRIITATSQNLKQMVIEGRFRADLFDRLNILNLETIPLRLQKEKIKELLLKGLNKECVSNGRTEPFEITEDAILSLEAYDWYGNYRELQNFATCLAVECLDDEIISLETVEGVMRKRINYSRFGKSTETASQYSNHFATNLVTVTFDPKTDDLNSIYLKAAGNVIEKVLSENNGNLRRAARKMGATHSTLSRIMKKFKTLSEDETALFDSRANSVFAAAS